LNLPQFAAIAFLALLILAPLVALGVVMARSRMNPLQCGLWVVAYFLCKFLWRTRWPGWLRLPPGRGAIIVCNHRSSVDPFFVQTGTGQKIHWMVAREYCEHFAFRWFLRNCEVIPVSRGGVDTAATKSAIRIVSQGGLVGMLPEGRINMTTDFMLPVRPGAALVALKARALVVPCYIHGAPYRRYPWSPLLMPARVEVRFGEPIDLAEFHGREGESGVVQEAMLRVLRALAHLAERYDYEPRLAGRNWKPTAEELEAAMAAAEAREQVG
jgi:1-acyl-sn-glycerol-3-phosphate acyltransferase